LAQNNFAVGSGRELHGLCPVLQIIRHFLIHVDADGFRVFSNWICRHNQSPFFNKHLNVIIFLLLCNKIATIFGRKSVPTIGTSTPVLYRNTVRAF
jgi:hypothetical protein